MKLSFPQYIGLMLLGAFWLGVMASAVRYSANPDVWPGEVIAYGVGTFAGLVGVFSFLAWLDSSVEAVKMITKSHQEESSAEQPTEQPVQSG